MCRIRALPYGTKGKRRFVFITHSVSRVDLIHLAGDLFFYTIDPFPLVRYIVRNIDGKYAVHKENSGVASFCESQEAALKLARKLAAEFGEGIERLQSLEGGAIAIWRELVHHSKPDDPTSPVGQ